MSQSLLDFIKHARQKGMDHATIRVLLMSAGWRERDIANEFAQEGLDLPVPVPPATGGAKEAFQYLVAFFTLSFVVVNFIFLSFQFIDKFYPDPSYLAYSSFTDESVRWSISALLIAFPIYLIFVYWIDGEMIRNPERSKSPVRRWLTYVALFGTAVTLTVDAIMLVYGFLQGDLTTRFLLQVFVVMAVSLIVFCYYLFSLRIPEETLGRELRKLDRSFGFLSLMLVGIAVVVGFSMVKSPFEARQRRLDAKRLTDLREIHQAIERMVLKDAYQSREQIQPLPKDLHEVAEFVSSDEYRRKLSIIDPVHGTEYRYVVTGNSTFELWAEFAFEEQSEYNWRHPPGLICFQLDIGKDLSRSGSVVGQARAP
ncbi:MAG: DUF5671 domain-containing protein [Pirellula sp.]